MWQKSRKTYAEGRGPASQLLPEWSSATSVLRIFLETAQASASVGIDTLLNSVALFYTLLFSLTYLKDHSSSCSRTVLFFFFFDYCKIVLEWMCPYVIAGLSGHSRVWFCFGVFWGVRA